MNIFTDRSRIFLVFRQTLHLAWQARPKMLVVVLCLGTLWGLLNLPILYLDKLIVDNVLTATAQLDKNGAIKTLVILVSLRSVMELTRQTTGRINSRLRNLLNRAVNAHIETIVGKKLAELDVATVEDHRFKAKLDRIRRESGSRIWSLVHAVASVPEDVVGIMSVTLPLYFFQPWLALILVLLVIPRILADYKITKQEYDLDRKTEKDYQLWGWLVYLLQRPKSFLETKLLNHTGHFAHRLDQVIDELIQVKEKMAVFTLKAQTLAELPSWTFNLLLSIWLFLQVILGKLTLGTAQFLFRVATSFLSYLESLANNLTGIYENYLYVSDLVWFLNLTPQQKPGVGKIPAAHFSQGVEFRHVWFRYPETEKWVLEDINFFITSKENMAIVGENGVGKSTLIKLLGGFYPPTQGQILVNGIDISEYNQKAYWEKLAFLFQDFGDYPFSAKETIGIGDITRINNFSEITTAAKLTDIHDYLESLPLKYDNPLARDFENGVEPSGGQWQRIALARTLFRQAEIIVLDEPTSNVDPQAEEEIFEKVIQLTRDKILVLISHRFSTVRRADRIIVLDKGRISEIGSHKELLAQNSLYAKLFKLQAKGYR